MEIFSPKCFSGHLQCCFDKPGEKISLIVRRKVFAQSAKKYCEKLKSLKQHTVAPKIFTGNLECSLQSAERNFRWQCEKISLKGRRIKTSPKTHFPSEFCSGYVACSFTTPQKAFRSKSKKPKKLMFFSIKKFFLQLFFWKCRMQFWRPCRKTSAQTPNAKQKYCFSPIKIFSFNKFFWTHRMLFWQSGR